MTDRIPLIHTELNPVTGKVFTVFEEAGTSMVNPQAVAKLARRGRLVSALREESRNERKHMRRTPWPMS